MRNNQSINQSAAQSCSFTCTFLCSEEPLTTMAESVRGNVFACGEMYFHAKACSKNNSILEWVDSRVQHIWRLRVKAPGTCDLRDVFMSL